MTVETDLELLRRFVHGSSQEAFAELVRRHIAWVSAAARRRVGGDAHLADEVAQAVFILLAKKSKSLAAARDVTLSPWLFQALRYCSLEALRTRRRQVTRDQQAGEIMRQQQSRSTEPQPSAWLDLAPQLDELVGQLGGTDRRAVLLRFYEQQTFGDVGRALGVSEEAARKRVDRAVQKLAGLFRRRGITVGAAALAATMITSVTPASAAAAAGAIGAAPSVTSAALTGSTPSAGAGLIAHGAAGMIAWAQAKAALLIIAATLALAAAGGGAIVLVAQSSAARSPAATAPAPATAPVATSQPTRVVSGHVLTPDEKPFAGATLLLVADDSFHEPHTFVSATSAVDGSFRIEYPRDASVNGVVVDAPPWGYTSAGVASEQPVDVIVNPPAQTTVRLLLPDGKPAAGVEVAPQFCASGGPMMDDWWSLTFPEDLRAKLARRTDGDGNVTFDRLPAKSRLRLDVRDDRFAGPTYRAEIATGDAPATVQLVAAGSIGGRVTFPDGKPAANVGIGAQSNDADGSGAWGNAVTDAGGNFRVARLHPGTYNVIVNLDKPLAEQWTAVAAEKVKVIASQARDGVDLRLIAGTTLRGKVTGKQDGRPIPGIMIGAYGPARPRSGGAVSFVTTGADGSYSMRVPPGWHYVYIGSDVPDGYIKSYDQQRELNVGNEGATVDFGLLRAPGKPVSGVVLDPDGKSVPRAWVAAQHDEDQGRFSGRGVAADEQGRFAFKALRAGSKLRASASRLRSMQPVTVRGGEKDVIVRVEKAIKVTLSGTVVDPAGKPIPTARVSLNVMVGRFGTGTLPRPVDAQGRYTIEGLRPDQRYLIDAQAPHFGRGGSEGEVQFKPGLSAIEQPPIVLKPANSIVMGTVIDDRGNPVGGGVEVSLSGRDTARQRKAAEANGHFEFGDVVEGDQLSLRARRGDQFGESTTVPAGSVNVTVPAPAAGK
jgi:RNA polymerase sigma factor (sigma-70 family)